MNREQMIEKAAEDLYLRVMVETRDEWPHFEFLPTAAQDLWLSDATKLIDAILPQVTTVEELEALPDGAVIVTKFGGTARRLRNKWATWGRTFLYHDEMAAGLPATVVWQR